MLTHKIWWTVCVVACSLALAAGQEQEKVIRHAPAGLSSPASGKEMFISYCAVCHGRDGKGGGLAADALKTRPADLTVLSQKNGGKFPAGHVSTAIIGDTSVTAHGTKEMPVWGTVLWRISQGDAAEYQQRIANLIKFVESLQTK